MPPRGGKKPATAQDLDALLLALTGAVEVPQQATNGKTKKRKRNKGSADSQGALLEGNDLESKAGKLAAGSSSKRKTGRALKASECKPHAASGKKRQKLTPKKHNLKSSARRPTAKEPAQEENNSDSKGTVGDAYDDRSREDSAETVAVAKRRKAKTKVEDIADGAPSPTTDDTGGEDFILVMKKMTLERKKQRERDAKKIDAFFLARMQKSEKAAEQKILAIGAQASEATSLYRTKEITAIQKKLQAKTKAVRDLSVSARVMVLGCSNAASSPIEPKLTSRSFSSHTTQNLSRFDHLPRKRFLQ